MLGSLLSGEVVAQMGGLVAFVNGIYGILLTYAIGYLTIPLIRYFWIQRRNKRIASRNEQRFQRAQILGSRDQQLQNKLQQAKEFAAKTVLSEEEVAYSTEQDLMEQEAERSDKIDEEWERRLSSE
jgi:predicted lipid-binding transport protein (Tim44 family)